MVTPRKNQECLLESRLESHEFKIALFRGEQSVDLLFYSANILTQV